MNDFHCPLSFVKSIAPLNVRPIDSMSSFILSIHRSLGLPRFLFPSNLAYSALCGNQPTVILSIHPNHQSFPGRLCLAELFVGCGGSVVSLVPCVRRVAGSNPTLAIK